MSEREKALELRIQQLETGLQKIAAMHRGAEPLAWDMGETAQEVLRLAAAPDTAAVQATGGAIALREIANMRGAMAHVPEMIHRDDVIENLDMLRAIILGDIMPADETPDARGAGETANTTDATGKVIGETYCRCPGCPGLSRGCSCCIGRQPLDLPDDV